VNDELEIIWKEVDVTQFRLYTGICPEGLRKTKKRISGLRAEI
jgi:hypothetical protein